MKERGRVWVEFSRFIRLRDAAHFTGMVKCCTCTGISHWKDVDAGHFISWSHKATQLNERNVHGQCKVCNGPGGGMVPEMRHYIDTKYGDGSADELLRMSKQVKKWFPFELRELAEYYKKEAEKIREEKNI